jgi:hypothetical protein
MHEPRVIIALLRQPKLGRPDEMRSDPFWEFGSFGITGCHAKNILNPTKVAEIEGSRLAFAQGGQSGFKLVFLTPPIHVVPHKDLCEVTWEPKRMPFCYGAAPLLVDNDGQSDFDFIPALLKGVRRTTFAGRFSSRFRTRRRPLPPELSAQMVAVFDRHVRDASSGMFAKTYVDALPHPPPKVDTHRRATYEMKTDKAERHRASCR